MSSDTTTPNSKPRLCWAHQIEPRPPELRWLVHSLWSAEAVGIIGGEPKSGKSLLSLQLAVSVASATPCLGRFSSTLSAPVLLHNGEDPPHDVRARLDAICAAQGLALDKLPIAVLTPRFALCLDRHTDQVILRECLARVKPKLLVLDPFVRLHEGLNENDAADVSRILSFLRELQREHQLAIILVHHTRKQTSVRTRPGQTLRGSSEFHAWGDSNLYLKRYAEKLYLSVEHRAAAAPDRLALRLATTELGCTLVIDDSPNPPAANPTRLGARDKLLTIFADASQPLSLRELQKLCRMRTLTITDAVSALLEEGTLVREKDGYRLRETINP